MFDRQESVRSPHETTCQWIFDRPEYKEWLNDSCALLWVKGDPGSGKSTLMSHIFKSLRSTKAANTGALHLLYFFSARGHELEHTPAGMLRSLLNQIFANVPEARPSIRGRYTDKKRCFGLPIAMPPWQQPELEDLFRDAVLTCSQTLETIILVDALDEAGEQSARSVAKYFHALHRQVKSRSGRLRLCLSCRHYPVPANTLGAEISVERHNGNDVKRFIHDSFEFFSQDEESKRQIDVLVQKAGGNFQWAELIVPMVEKLWLDGTRWDDIICWIGKIPKQLVDVYTHIIQNVIDERHRLPSFLLLMSVCIAQRPLTVEELFALIEHAPSAWTEPATQQEQTSMVGNDIELLKVRVRTLSGGLARTMVGYLMPAGTRLHNGVVAHRIKSDRIRVELVHETVNEYLVNGGLATLEKLSKSHIAFLPAIQPVSEQQSLRVRYHAVLYRICLRYLIDVRTRVAAKTRTPWGRLSSYANLDETNLPLFAYAIFHMVEHATEITSVTFLDPQAHMKLLRTMRDFWFRVAPGGLIFDEDPSETLSIMLKPAQDIGHCEFWTSGKSRDRSGVVSQLLRNREVFYIS